MNENLILLKLEAMSLFTNCALKSQRYSEQLIQTEKKVIDEMYSKAEPIVKNLLEKYPQVAEIYKFGDLNLTTIPGMIQIFLDAWEKDASPDALDIIKKHIHPYLTDAEIASDLSVYELASKSPLLLQEKWLLIWMYENPVDVYEQFGDIVNAMIPIISEYQDILAQQIDLVYTQWNERIIAGEYKTLLKDKMGVDLGTPIKNLYVSFVGSAYLVIRKDTIFVGLQFTDEYFKQQTVDQETTNNILKLLGDPSKYNILKELLSGEKYGRQLSTNLGLSAATISYHIQELTNLGLVSVKTQDKSNRIYFQLRKETIEDVIRFIVADLQLNL